MLIKQISFQKAHPGFTGEGSLNYKITLVKDGVPVWDTGVVPPPDYPNGLPGHAGIMERWAYLPEGWVRIETVDILPETETLFLLYVLNVEADSAIIETGAVGAKGQKFLFDSFEYIIPREWDEPAHIWPELRTDEIVFPPTVPTVWEKARPVVIIGGVIVGLVGLVVLASKKR